MFSAYVLTSQEALNTSSVKLDIIEPRIYLSSLRLGYPHEVIAASFVSRDFGSNLGLRLYMFVSHI